MTDRYKKVFNYIAVLLSLLLFVSGCGGDGFVDLTEEESKQIVNYSTNVLNDHNSAVKGSLKNLTKTDLRDIVIKDDPSLIQEIQEAKEEATAEAEEAAKPKPAEPEKNESSGEEESDESKPLDVQYADIAALIGLNGFSVEYSGHKVQDSYPDPSDS